MFFIDFLVDYGSYLTLVIIQVQHSVAFWFVLTLSRSSSNVEVIRHS